MASLVKGHFAARSPNKKTAQTAAANSTQRSFLAGLFVETLSSRIATSVGMAQWLDARYQSLSTSDSLLRGNSSVPKVLVKVTKQLHEVWVEGQLFNDNEHVVTHRQARRGSPLSPASLRLKPH